MSGYHPLERFGLCVPETLKSPATTGSRIKDQYHDGSVRQPCHQGAEKGSPRNGRFVMGFRADCVPTLGTEVSLGFQGASTELAIHRFNRLHQVSTGD